MLERLPKNIPSAGFGSAWSDGSGAGPKPESVSMCRIILGVAWTQVRSQRHNFRFVLGEFCDGSLAHVQVLGHHRGRGAGNPVGQGDICEIRRPEDFKELQVGAACVLDVMPEVLL